MDDEEEIDIYDDLEDLDLSEKLRVANKTIVDLKEELQILQQLIKTLEASNKILEKQQSQMKKNSHSLLATAKCEIDRKNNEINSLRKEKDDICFRRFKGDKKVAKKTVACQTNVSSIDDEIDDYRYGGGGGGGGGGGSAGSGGDNRQHNSKDDHHHKHQRHKNPFNINSNNNRHDYKRDGDNRDYYSSSRNDFDLRKRLKRRHDDYEPTSSSSEHRHRSSGGGGRRDGHHSREVDGRSSNPNIRDNGIKNSRRDSCEKPLSKETSDDNKNRILKRRKTISICESPINLKFTIQNDHQNGNDVDRKSIVKSADKTEVMDLNFSQTITNDNFVPHKKDIPIEKGGDSKIEVEENDVIEEGEIISTTPPPKKNCILIDEKHKNINNDTKKIDTPPENIVKITPKSSDTNLNDVTTSKSYTPSTDSIIINNLLSSNVMDMVYSIINSVSTTKSATTSSSLSTITTTTTNAKIVDKPLVTKTTPSMPSFNKKIQIPIIPKLSLPPLPSASQLFEKKCEIKIDDNKKTENPQKTNETISKTTENITDSTVSSDINEITNQTDNSESKIKKTNHKTVVNTEPTLSLIQQPSQLPENSTNKSENTFGIKSFSRTTKYKKITSNSIPLPTATTKPVELPSSQPASSPSPSPPTSQHHDSQNVSTKTKDIQQKSKKSQEKIDKNVLLVNLFGASPKPSSKNESIKILNNKKPTNIVKNPISKSSQPPKNGLNVVINETINKTAITQLEKCIPIVKETHTTTDNKKTKSNTIKPTKKEVSNDGRSTNTIESTFTSVKQKLTKNNIISDDEDDDDEPLSNLCNITTAIKTVTPSPHKTPPPPPPPTAPQTVQTPVPPLQSSITPSKLINANSMMDIDEELSNRSTLKEENGSIVALLKGLNKNPFNDIFDDVVIDPGSLIDGSTLIQNHRSAENSIVGEDVLLENELKTMIPNLNTEPQVDNNIIPINDQELKDDNIKKSGEPAMPLITSPKTSSPIVTMETPSSTPSTPTTATPTTPTTTTTTTTNKTPELNTSSERILKTLGRLTYYVEEKPLNEQLNGNDSIDGGEQESVMFVTRKKKRKKIKNV